MPCQLQFVIIPKKERVNFIQHYSALYGSVKAVNGFFTGIVKYTYYNYDHHTAMYNTILYHVATIIQMVKLTVANMIAGLMDHF